MERDSHVHPREWFVAARWMVLRMGWRNLLHACLAYRRRLLGDRAGSSVHTGTIDPAIYYHYLVHDYGSRDDYDYNGGRKGYYNPAVNYDYLYDSGSTASPATSASRANNDRARDDNDDDGAGDNDDSSARNNHHNAAPTAANNNDNAAPVANHSRRNQCTVTGYCCRPSSPHGYGCC